MVNINNDRYIMFVILLVIINKSRKCFTCPFMIAITEIVTKSDTSRIKDRDDF